VRAAGRPLAGFSEALTAEERELKRFLYQRLYDLPELKPVRKEAERVVENADPEITSEDRERVMAHLKNHWQRRYGLVEVG